MTGLKARQQRAVAVLLEAPNVEEAARRSGIPARTLHRWLIDETFRTAYREAGHQRLAETVSRLRAAANEAVAALRAALDDQHTANRIRAATVLLDTAVRVEVDDLAERVAALEEAQRLRRCTRA